MVNDEQCVLQLNNIKDITTSDILAFALLESGTRKLSWHTLLGAENKRTIKTKQSATAGVTAKALRTGKPQSYSMDIKEKSLCFGEAIMMTEQLSHIYIWPVMYHEFSYRGVIIIGRKANIEYDNHQLEKATQLIATIEKYLIRVLF